MSYKVFNPRYFEHGDDCFTVFNVLTEDGFLVKDLFVNRFVPYGSIVKPIFSFENHHVVLSFEV